MVGFLPSFRFPFILIGWFGLRFPSFVPFPSFFSFVSFPLFGRCARSVPPLECAPSSETQSYTRGRIHFEGYLRSGPSAGVFLDLSSECPSYMTFVSIGALLLSVTIQNYHRHKWRLQTRQCLPFYRLIPLFVETGLLSFIIFSERELTFTFAICCRPSVCRLSVCLSVVCLSSVCL